MAEGVDNYLNLGITGYTRVYFFHSKEDMEKVLAIRPDIKPVMGHGGGLDYDYPGVYFAVSKR